MKYILITIFIIASSLSSFGQSNDEHNIQYSVDTNFIMQNMRNAINYIKDRATKKCFSLVEKNDSLLSLRSKLKQEFNFYSSYLRQKTLIYFYSDDIEKALEVCDTSEQVILHFSPEPSLLYAEVAKDKFQCYYLLGRMKEADYYNLKCKGIFEKLPNYTTIRQYRDVLKDIGTYYLNFNRLEEARDILLTRYEYVQSQISPDTLELASAMADHAYAELSLRNTDFALNQFIKSINLFENNKANMLTFFYWETLSNTGSCYKLMAKPDSAEYYYLKCYELSNQLRALTPDHIAGINLTLGVFYLENGKFADSKSFLKNGILLMEKVFGEDHPLSNYVHGYLGNYYFMNPSDTSGSAFKIYAKMQRNAMKDFTKSYTYMSIDEQEASKADFDDISNFLFSILANNTQNEETEVCYDILLAKKDFLLNSIRRLRNLAREDNELMELFQSMQKNRRQLGNELAKSNYLPGALDSLKANIENLEKQLAYTLPEKSDSLHFVKTVDLRKALNSDEVSIEFCKFQFKPDLVKKNEVPTYAAMVLDNSGRPPIFVKLFTQTFLDSILNVSNLSDFTKADFIYRNNTVSELIWTPLRQHLQNKSKIYLASDGSLQLINLAVLPYDKRAINDLFEITVLNTTSDIMLLKSKTNNLPKNKSIDIFSHANFDYPDPQIDTISGIDTQRSENLVGSDSISFSHAWSPIRHSDEEGKYIEKLMKKAGWGTNLYSGNSASEDTIKKYQFGSNFVSPFILHISTHGYFSPTKAIRSINFQENKDPLLRSGLVMRGANKHSFSLEDGIEDGFLTALEISQLDLSHTELVVLSACETGLGDISTPEGVYGLRRALKIAGADKLLLTLWRIPDYQTVELMKLFYTNMVDQKMDPKKALYESQKVMRIKKYDPYYWAGFMLIE